MQPLFGNNSLVLFIPMPPLGVLQYLPRVMRDISMGVKKAPPRVLAIISTPDGDRTFAPRSLGLSSLKYRLMHFLGQEVKIVELSIFESIAVRGCDTRVDIDEVLVRRTVTRTRNDILESVRGESDLYAVRTAA